MKLFHGMKKMNLITFKHRYDFGHEWYVQILNTGKHVPGRFKNLSLIQASVSYNDYPSWPYLQVYCGNGALFGVIIWCYKFGLDFDLVRRTWSWDHLDKLDEQEVDSGSFVA